MQQITSRRVEAILETSQSNLIRLVASTNLERPGKGRAMNWTPGHVATVWLAQRLINRGLTYEAAVGIARQVAPELPVLLENESAERYLLVVQNRPGLDYSFAVVRSVADTLDFVAKAPTAIFINLTEVLRTVLEALLVDAQERKNAHA